jgi:hypothetical protein
MHSYSDKIRKISLTTYMKIYTIFSPYFEHNSLNSYQKRIQDKLLGSIKYIFYAPCNFSISPTNLEIIKQETLKCAHIS